MYKKLNTSFPLMQRLYGCALHHIALARISHDWSKLFEKFFVRVFAKFKFSLQLCCVVKHHFTICGSKCFSLLRC